MNCCCMFTSSGSSRAGRSPCTARGTRPADRDPPMDPPHRHRRPMRKATTDTTTAVAAVASIKVDRRTSGGGGGGGGGGGCGGAAAVAAADEALFRRQDRVSTTPFERRFASVSIRADSSATPIPSWTATPPCNAQARSTSLALPVGREYGMSRKLLENGNFSCSSAKSQRVMCQLEVLDMSPSEWPSSSGERLERVKEASLPRAAVRPRPLAQSRNCRLGRRYHKSSVIL